MSQKNNGTSGMVLLKELIMLTPTQHDSSSKK
jgi:hypothetical protein